MPDFVPNDQKASQIATQVDKEQNKNTGEEEADEQPEPPKHDVEVVGKKYTELV